MTEVAPAGDFWEAEPEHQDYLQRYPDGYTCHFVRPKLGAAGARGPRREARVIPPAACAPTTAVKVQLSRG